MNSLKHWWLRTRLRVLLKQGFRERIPMGSEESWNNNDVVVRFHPNFDSDSYPIAELTDAGFDTRHLDDSDQEIVQTWTWSNAMSDKQFSVRHFYAVWTIEYSSLTEAFLCVLFRFNYFRLLSQRRFDRGLRERRDLQELLKVLINLWEPKFGSTIPIEKILEELYGPSIRTSRRSYDYHRRLTFMLQSLASSGEVALDHDDIPSQVTLLPRALRTAADFETDSIRHRDSLRITRLQLWVAIAMLFVALATLYTRLDQPATQQDPAAESRQPNPIDPR